MNRKLTIVFVLAVMLALIASCANNNEKLKEETFLKATLHRPGRSGKKYNRR